MAGAKIFSTMIAIMVFSGLLQSASAKTYSVDWKFPDTATQYNDWAAQQSFKVGDVLSFVYTSAHNVYEVSRSDLNNCVTSKAIKTSGGVKADVTLTRSGYYGFICGVPGHCSVNMKMSVDVSA